MSRYVRAVAETLEARQLLTVTIDPIADVTYPGGKAIFVPVNGTTTGSTALAYQVSTSDARISARVLQNVTFVDMTIAIGGVTQATPLQLALFGDIAPNTVARIVELVNADFYDGLKFHRIIPNFMAQGGDPLGTGSGGTGTRIDDEFNADAIFDTPGLLAMANSNGGGRCDTNDSQFFITAVQTRWLDFRHTIFGQLLDGQATFNAMMAQGTSGGVPSSAVTIVTANVVEDLGDAVVLIKGPAGVSGSVTLAVTDAAGNATRVINVNGVTDSQNDPPFLGPVHNLSPIAGQSATLKLTATDLEGDAPYFAAAVATGDDTKIDVAVAGDILTVTPKNGFTGTAQVLVGVYQFGSNYDTQWLTVTNNSVEVRGTAGPDTISVWQSGSQLLVDINGQQRTYMVDGVTRVSVTGDAGDDTITIAAGLTIPCSIIGQTGDDTITGGDGNDTIYGGDGHDSITGGAGDDSIYGNFGNDTIYAGAGADSIMGGLGQDSMFGGIGNDFLWGGDQQDTIFGDDGDDYIEGKGKADEIHGGAGNDTLLGMAGADSLYGDEGDDSFDTRDTYVLGGVPGAFCDVVDGGDGADVLYHDDSDIWSDVENLLT